MISLCDTRPIYYTIDGLNPRIGKSVNGAPVQGLVYINQLEPVAELDGAGNIAATFLYAERAHVPSMMLKGGNTYLNLLSGDSRFAKALADLYRPLPAESNDGCDP